MKKYIPYFLAVLLATGIIILFLTGNNKKHRRLDERVTLRRQDKIPYGTYVAYKALKYIFPNAIISPSRDEPGYWDSLSSNESGQALIIVTGQFNADESEMKKLISFMEDGNDVFVSALTLSYSVTSMLDCNINSSEPSSYYPEEPPAKDSLYLALNAPPFTKSDYTYPGRNLDASFGKIDETTSEILGKDDKGQPNFIHLRSGKGNLYIHLAPLAFTNYFLLHKENIGYYEKMLSVISKKSTKVVWDEYYLNKKFRDENNRDKKSWLSVLSQYPGLKAGLLTAMVTLLLYVLLEMRRKQRYIPVVAKPRNDSLDFVKTIGRLYFDKGDHKNLCRKMSAYFLEHVRSKYKLPTGELDEEFVRKLKYKSGAEEHDIRGIISFIRYVEDAPAISDRQLSDFHKQLEIFYTKA